MKYKYKIGQMVFISRDSLERAKENECRLRYYDVDLVMNGLNLRSGGFRKIVALAQWQSMPVYTLDAASIFWIPEFALSIRRDNENLLLNSLMSLL